MGNVVTLRSKKDQREDDAQPMFAPILNHMKAHLDDRFADLWQRGFYQEYAWWVNGNDRGTDFPTSQMRRILRQQSKQWGRPFIVTGVFASPNMQDRQAVPHFSGRITIPKSERCEVIASPLFLLSQHPTTTRNTKLKTYWEYEIADPDVWDSYMRWLHTDPDARQAIGVPKHVAPLPYEVTAHDIMRECQLKWPGKDL